MRKLFLVSLFLFALLLSDSFIEPAVSKTMVCRHKCKARCSKAGVYDRCMKYCQLCCAKCKCVPSGTYGNKHQCPCYRDMRNSKGKPKCP